MARIDPDALATHLEVALSCAPLETLAALQDGDRQRRRHATFTLAQHLADRLTDLFGRRRTPPGLKSRYILKLRRLL